MTFHCVCKVIHVVMLYLHLVLPLTNVALRKPSQQSSTVLNAPASFGVDGIKMQDFRKLSCFHTDRELQPWWQVDLESLHYIKNFVLYNRVDGDTASRAQDIEVQFGQTWSTMDRVDFISDILPNIYNKTFEHAILMRYAKITRRSFVKDYIGYFHLCEVELYGYKACTTVCWYNGTKLECQCTVTNDGN